MCIGVCLPSNQDTTSAIIGSGDTLDFSFHFFTDPLMLGSDTGRARIRFVNENGGQQHVIQNYKGITYGEIAFPNSIFQLGYKLVDLPKNIILGIPAYDLMRNIKYKIPLIEILAPKDEIEFQKYIESG